MPIRRFLRAGLTLGVIAAAAPAITGRPATQPSSQAITFDRYHSAREIKTALDRLVAASPKLARLTSIGRDLRGFDLWLIEITNQETGPAAEKPAMFAAANLDGDDPVATEVLLELAQRALSGYGTDAALTALLDSTALFILPAANPFVGDQYVTTPLVGMLPGNTRPRDDDRDRRMDEDPPEDLDGDGHILQMRLRSAAGPFRTDPKHPRLLVRRVGNEPGEWIIHPEGLDNDRDGRINEDPVGGVDLNRNFPFDWKPEAVQEGAGEFALSEPESRAIADFFSAHPNIGIALDARGGPDGAPRLLRPYGGRPDSALPAGDLKAMTGLVASLAQAVPNAALTAPYGELALTRNGRLEFGYGLFSDWAYEMHGAVALAPEHGVALPDVELLRLSDAEYGGRLFVPWKPYPHPTLGRVEIGGFVKLARPNPPPGKPLEQLARSYAAGYLRIAAALPRLVLSDVQAVNEHGGFTIRARLENVGTLPTNVTERSLATRTAAPVVAAIGTSPSVIVLGENARQELGHLGPGATQAKTLTWAVRLALADAPGPHWVEIAVTSAKAGTLKKRVPLESRGFSRSPIARRP